MTADEFIQLDNQPGRLDPEWLESLRTPGLFLSAVSGGKRPKLEAEGVDDDSAWRVELDEGFVVGRLGQEGEAIPPPSLEAPAELELAPHLPKGGGITYHPKVGAASTKLLRRRNGQRVIPHYVFGADDRQVFFPSGFPWNCIGKLLVWYNPSGPPSEWGTGALVGRNVVLTASHMVPWGVNPWMMQFIPGYWNGSSTVSSGLSSFVQAYQGYRDHAQGDDMAVLKLYDPLGDNLGYFGFKTYDDGWEDGNYWTKVGYPQAIGGGERPSKVELFPIIDDDSDGAGVELEYHADESGGDSGGPVFGWWDDGPYVIGTHSGSEQKYEFPASTNQNNLAAGGSALSNLIEWGRSHW